MPGFSADSALEQELDPGTFNLLPQERAAEVLHQALHRGILKYRSTAEVAAWLEARPNAWRTPYRLNPLRAYNSELVGLAPESQAWLLVAVYRVIPELARPTPTVDDPERPFDRLDFRAASIGDPADHPAAAAIIAERIRSNLAAWRSASASTPISLGSPLAEWNLLVGVRPGDPELAADAQRVALALELNGTWSAAAQITLGRTLIKAAEKARTDADRSALVRPATDAIIEGTARYYLARPDQMHAIGPMYPAYGGIDEAVIREIIREIESRFLERAAGEACPNFGEDVLPVSRKALTELWIDRFEKGADALCLWYPPHWVPGSEIVAQHPEAVQKLVLHPDRDGDVLRREILVKALGRYVFADGDWTGASDRGTVRFCSENAGPDCIHFTDPTLARAIRNEVKPPSFRLHLDAHGEAIVRFSHPRLENAWRSRPVVRSTGPLGPAALAALLGAAEKDIRPLLEEEFVPRGCRIDRLPSRVWADPQNGWRLAAVDCATRTRSTGPLPLESAAWPRDASDAEAFSWLVWNYRPLILADAQGARLVWLPERCMDDSGANRITGFFALDGAILMVVQRFAACGARCGDHGPSIEMCELTQNVFSYLRNAAPPTRGH